MATSKEFEPKIVLEWGKAGLYKPPTSKEIENTLVEMRKRASKSNAFDMHLSGGMVSYLREHLDSSNAVMKLIDHEENDTQWVMVGINKETVDAAIARI